MTQGQELNWHIPQGTAHETSTGMFVLFLVGIVSLVNMNNGKYRGGAGCQLIDEQMLEEGKFPQLALGLWQIYVK